MAQEVQTRIGRRTIPNQEIFLVSRNLSDETFWRDPGKKEGKCNEEYILSRNIALVNHFEKY